MIAKLFDIQNGKIVPTEHCYTISWLKNIMDEYKDNEEYLKVYQYLYYMLYPNPVDNPYFNFRETEKEEQILIDIEAEFSTEDDLIQRALKELNKMYETPTSRAYNGMKTMLDKLSDYMKNTTITDGRDGNIGPLIRAAKDFEAVRASFKGVYKDLEEEQTTKIRGNKGQAYDQM